MRAKNIVISAACVALTGLVALSYGCSKNQKDKKTSNTSSYSIAFDKFGDYMSEFDMESPEYDNNAAIDTILNSIINSSSFEGLNNQLTLMAFKNNISLNGLKLSQFINFCDRYADENGNITIATENGSLKYTKDSKGNAKCKFTSSKEVEDEVYHTSIPFAFESTCEYYAASGNKPEHVKMTISYRTGESDYISASSTYSVDKGGSLKYASGEVSASNGSFYPDNNFMESAFSYVIDGFECCEPPRICFTRISEERATKMSDAFKNASKSLKP